MDFAWGGIETTMGSYGWSNYDWLTSNLTSLDIKPYYILDYGNPLYYNSISPNDTYSRNAFARFAANATLHFQGNNILWEMWNEPNIAFWTPTPNVTSYIALAQTTGNAIKAATPHEIYIGPASAGVDWNFLTSCITSGLLNVWDAVSVHFYRGNNPEQATADYASLRSLIRKNKPSTKPYVGLISGEWGYTTVVNVSDSRKVTEEVQAQYVTRQYLSNLQSDIPVSIWYDFHDDGTDPTNSEHRFGLFRNYEYTNRTLAYDPKPSGVAAIAFSTFLRQLSFNKQIDVGNSSAYVALYTDSDMPSTVVLVAWSTLGDISITIPVSNGQFNITNMYGNQSAVTTVSNGVLSITVNAEPQYIVPKATNQFLQFISGIKRLPLETVGYGNITIPIIVPNWGTTSVAVQIGSEAQVTIAPNQTAVSQQVVFYDIQNTVSQLQKFVISVSGMASVTLSTTLLYDYPLSLYPTIPSSSQLPFQVYNPQGTAFTGTLQVTVGTNTTTTTLNVASGVTASVVNATIQHTGNATDKYTVSYKILDSTGKVAGVGSNSYQLADDISKYTAGSLPSTYVVTTAPVNNVSITYSIIVPSTPYYAPGNVPALKFTYTADAGYKYLQVLPKTKVPINGNATTVGQWIYGDGNGNAARVRVVDSQGQTFQLTFGQVTWTGWQYKTVAVGGTSFWGGPADGVIHWPISWDTYFLWDSSQNAQTGIMYFTAPVAIF